MHSMVLLKLIQQCLQEPLEKNRNKLLSNEKLALLFPGELTEDSFFCHQTRHATAMPVQGTVSVPEQRRKSHDLLSVNKVQNFFHQKYLNKCSIVCGPLITCSTADKTCNKTGFIPQHTLMRLFCTELLWPDAILGWTPTGILCGFSHKQSVAKSQFDYHLCWRKPGMSIEGK